MSYQSLYRRYRPNKLSDVVSQQHIMEVLVNSIKKDKVSHAYLFCGPRGTGKTSIAKLFAKAVNCTNKDDIACGVCENCQAAQDSNHPDIIEIDAASNNGVDEIRGLIERVKYTPIAGKYKVYIIDEVHMLSQGAFNALLKTLEEPPSHVVFILATTEIHKVLPTIISRCQRFDFSRIPNEAIEARLDYILKNEGVVADPGVTKAIANLSGGGLRNALTILEQAIVLAKDTITLEEIYESNGLITPKAKLKLFESIVEANMTLMLDIIKQMQTQSVAFERLLMEFVTDIKDSIILTHTRSKTLVDQNNLEFTSYLDNVVDVNVRLNMINILLSMVEKMKFSQQPEMYFDVAMLELYASMNNINSEENRSIKDVENEKPKIAKEETIFISDDEREESHETSNDNSITKEEIYLPPVSMQLDIEEEDTETHPIEIEKPELQIPSVDQLVEFMVSANKEMRKLDSERFAQKVKYRNNPSWARPARLLDDFNLVLSGDFFVVVASDRELSVKELSEGRNKEALYQFAKEIFGVDKVIIPSTTQDFKDAIDKFVIAQKSGTLPNPITKEKLFMAMPSLDQAGIDPHLEKVQDLFGDLLEIKE